MGKYTPIFSSEGSSEPLAATSTLDINSRHSREIRDRLTELNKNPQKMKNEYTMKVALGKKKKRESSTNSIGTTS